MSGTRSGPRTPARVAVAVAALALLVALGASDTARAGTYDVWSCRDADDAPAATAAWVPYNEWLTNGARTVTDACGTGGGMAVALVADRAHVLSGAELRFDAPEGTRISDFEIWRAGTVAPDPAAGFDYISGLERLSQDDGIIARETSCVNPWCC